ncbi:hypothetical protein PR048_024560 [Dryococelus australis]|uniref:Uncharacterized protein n=1 Tax=Dryococelus australis TaxID=614101 RepID=A0ABQ9GNY7_9NEOP|nr:hypothetical protein PR048_024560 [Dryococelus australis]
MEYTSPNSSKTVATRTLKSRYNGISCTKLGRQRSTFSDDEIIKEKRGGRPEALHEQDQERREAIMKYISRFPRMGSHYCRESSTTREYADLNKQKMREMKGDADKKAEMEAKFDDRQWQKQAVRENKREIKEDPYPKKVCATFDLQQVIFLPKTNDSMIFYIRGFPGQNKNATVTTMLLHTACNSKNIFIEFPFIFFKPNHGRNKGDSAHSCINTATEAAADVYVPSQLVPIFRIAKVKSPIYRPFAAGR